VADATAISITAIIAAAVIGPAISAWSERRRDEGRFIHERQLGDAGNLRALLDEGADRLAEIEQSLAILRGLFFREGVWTPSDEAIASYRERPRSVVREPPRVPA
jgi:hypothetical protein